MPFPCPLELAPAGSLRCRTWISSCCGVPPAAAGNVGDLSVDAEHDLGRKRLLDTLLAATYYRGGVTRIVTSNARDYRVFGVFDLIEI